MKQTISDMQKEVNEAKTSLDCYELTLQILDKSNKFKEKYIAVLAFLLCFSLCIIAYMGYQMANGTYTVTTETTQEGLYNFYDSEGNLVSSDLSLEEMQELIELNEGLK